jgi:multidrug efflux pump
VQVDRELAGRLGVSMQTVVDTLSNAFGQRQISTIYGQANQYRVILEAMPQYQNDPSSLSKIYVPASGIAALPQSSSLTSNAPAVIASFSGTPMVPLSAIARFEHTTAPLVIAHQEQFPAVTISFNLAPDASLGDAVKVISEAERTIGMPPSVIGSYSGDAEEFAKSLAGEPWLILAAVVAIYIVLEFSTRASSIRSPSCRHCPRRASAPCWH